MEAMKLPFLFLVELEKAQVLHSVLDFRVQLETRENRRQQQKKARYLESIV